MRKTRSRLKRCFQLFMVAFIAFPGYQEVVAQCTVLTGNYTIDRSKATGGKNFQSLGEAAAALSCGISTAVTFDVVPGTTAFNEQFAISPVPGASATKTITFNGNGAVLEFLSTSSFSRAGIKLDGADHVIIDSFVINPLAYNEYEYGYGVQLLRNADSNIIKRCHINVKISPFGSQNAQGIVVNAADELENEWGNTSCDYNLITGNTITGGGNGISLFSFMGYASVPVRITNNILSRNTLIGQAGHGIYLFGVINTLIDSNDISGMLPNCPAIELSETAIKNTITNNRIHDPFVDPSYEWTPAWDAINIGNAQTSDGNESILANNLIYNFKMRGDVKGIHIVSTSHVKVYHNTILLDNADASLEGSVMGIHVEDGRTDLSLINNIVMVTTAIKGTHYGIRIDEPGLNFVSKRNDLYVVSPNANANSKMGYYLGKSYTTIPTWQAATKLDYGSISVDPLFANAATGDLSPTETVMNDMGIYVNISKDIKGAARNNSSPDIGAYEFLTPVCSTPVVAGTSTILPQTTVCEGYPVTLNLAGNNFGTNQTYQWQTSSTETGTYANMGNTLAYPVIETKLSQTVWLRAGVTCGTTTVYSTPIQVFVNAALPKGTYTINKAQATGGTNFTSFTDAVQAMKCGIGGAVVFNVTPNSGPYTEQIVIPYINQASATNTITFNGNGNVLQFNATASDKRAVIRLDSADYVTLDSLEIKPLGDNDGSEYGFGVMLINDADNNIIRRCKITGNTVVTSNRYVGILINTNATSATSTTGKNYCDSNLVENNTVTGFGYGITAVAPYGNYIYGNKILRNTVQDFYNYGIYFSYHDHLLVEGNIVSRPTRTAGTGCYGIFVGGTSINSSVSKNLVYNLYGGNNSYNSNTASTGIFLSSAYPFPSTPLIISNNVVYQYNGQNLQYGITNSGSTDVQIYHNTIVFNNPSSTSTRDARGYYHASGATGDFRDNLVYINRGGTGKKYAVYDGDSDPEAMKLNNNNYYNGSSTGYAVGYIGGTAYTTMADWQGATSQETNSLTINPLFVNIASLDFTPNETTLDNKGLGLGITDDYNGKKRHATKPDIGAIEFVKCSVFPVVTIDPDSIAVCTGNTATFFVKEPNATDSFYWYNAATGGIATDTGISYAVTNVTAPVEYYVEVVTEFGCVSTSRAKIKAIALAPFTVSPAATVDTVTTSAIVFEWPAVPGAVAYQVSRDGVNFTDPSSGPTGLTHIISGLKPLDTASIVVRAIGAIECQQIVGARGAGQTLTSQIYVPNTFSPNGDGHNETFRVYSNQMKTMRLMIFNQWGEKVFETADINTGWNGIYKGKPAPIGVYVYVVKMTLLDGTEETKKGSLNLVR